MRFGSAQLSVLAMASIFAACGGRADRDASSLGGSGSAGASSGGSIASGGSATSSSAGRGGSGEGGSAAGASGGASASGSGGASASGSGGASGSAGTSGDGGIGGSAGASGSGGTGGSSMLPDVTALLGDYDLWLVTPPPVEDCTPDWYVPRLNLGITQNDEGELVAEAFADFQWSWGDEPAPSLGADTLVLPASRVWDNTLVAPELTLDVTEQGLSATGVAEIPYSCDGELPTTRTVAVEIKPDITPPKLLLEPGWPRSGPAFAFTGFSFNFSEPVLLPSGDYLSWFEEPSDGATVAELWDTDTGEAFAVGWRWSLAGPVTVANFAEPELAELRNVSARVVEAVNDRAGNALVALGHVYQILPAAPFTTQIDFDDGPVVGIHGNATYHAQPGPDAPCEQGGCVVLGGPVPLCSDPAMPASLFAVRLPEPWDYQVDLRYRVWASTQHVSPISVVYASGCLGEYSANLPALAEPDGPFTHAGPWTDGNIGPCGGPDRENGFVITLGCVLGPEVPEVRVVIESVVRSDPP